MRFKSWAPGLMTVTLACATLLSACGGGGGSSDSTTNVRLLNASVGYSSLDLAVDSKTVNSNVAYGSAGSYASVNTGATASQVQTSGVGSTVASATPTLTAGSSYTMIAYGWSGAVRTTLLQEAEEAPAAAKSKFLVLNLAPDAGALDVYLTASTDTLENATPVATNIAGGSGSGYNSLNSGSYRLRLTGSGSKTDLRLDIPAITLASAGVSSLIITATDGGLLVNGMVVEQKGSISNFATQVSRARVVAAVAGNATVAAQINGASLLPSSVAPTIGDYQTVAAGASSLSLSINGAPMSVSAPTLKAGGDYTLLVWGDASAPQLTVLSDDNRLPVTSGTVKIRMVNGVASLNTGLTMTLDYSAIATNVVPGSASAISHVSASTSSLLSVNSPTSSTPVYSIAALPVVANGVYTVFMMGASGAMVGTLRKER